MINLSPDQFHELLKIYIGQNVREYGILQNDIKKSYADFFLHNELIEETKWYLYLYRTTEKADQICKEHILNIIQEKKDLFTILTYDIPKNVVLFFIEKYISKELSFSSTRKKYFLNVYEEILNDKKIWDYWIKLFNVLIKFNLSYKSHYYVSTNSGEKRELYYVISSEIQNFLKNSFKDTKKTTIDSVELSQYTLLLELKNILKSDNINYIREQYYNKLHETGIREDVIKKIIDDMYEKGITSKYHGLMSTNKPYDILDNKRYDIYIRTKFVKNYIDNTLLKINEKVDVIKVSNNNDFQETKLNLDILDQTQLGEFYIIVVTFEKNLREFIKRKLGKGWAKRISNEVPIVLSNWSELKDRDLRWGIDPESELINYSNLADYIQIFKKYNFFTKGENLEEIITHLRIWYNQGRNPLMHARTVNLQKYHTTKSAIEYLESWIKRKN